MTDVTAGGPVAELLESALLLVVAEAEPAVARHRAAHDPAARVGVPAHLTVAYPFKPADLLTGSDVALLEAVCRSTPAIDLVLSRTGWFGDEVLFLEPDDPASVVRLVRRIEGAFPEWPLYGGAHDDIVPHLTIAHGGEVAILREVEREVLPHLPLSHRSIEVQLWQGPPLSCRAPGWRPVRTFPLAAPLTAPDR